MKSEQKRRAIQMINAIKTRGSTVSLDAVADLLNELLWEEAAPEQAAVVPDELPTKEMTAAFSKVFNVRKQRETFGPAVRAMLAAAPEAPAVQSDVVRDAERYRWLRDRMSFDSSPDGNHKMSLARPILATNHNFNTDFMGDRFDASVDAAIDAAMQAQKGGES